MSFAAAESAAILNVPTCDALSWVWFRSVAECLMESFRSF